MLPFSDNLSSTYKGQQKATQHQRPLLVIYCLWATFSYCRIILTADLREKQTLTIPFL